MNYINTGPKIVVSNEASDKLHGIVAALTAMKENILFWSREGKSTLDMLDEVKPDILICTTQYVDDALRLGLEDYPDCKLVLFGAARPVGVTPAAMVFPDDITPPKLSFPTLHIKPAANLAKFCNGKYVKEYESDLLYISDFDIQNSPILNFLSELMGLKLRIVGPYKIPFAEYCGNCSLPVLCNVMKSAKIGLDFLGKHCYDYAINKVCCVASQPNGFTPIMNQDIDLLAFIRDEKLRKKHIKIAYNHAKENTYFHRVNELMQVLGYDSIGEKALGVMEAILSND